jgi:putative acyl-CoA dehydrogenase
VARLRHQDAVGVLLRPHPLIITLLVRLSKKCNISGMPDTHVVTNQVPPLENYNPASSAVLVEALIREGGRWGLDEVTELGAISGSRQAQRWGELADRNRPILHTHDRYGHRVDEVEYDPAYHELMRTAISHGLHAAPWADDRPGAHVVRAAKTSVWTVEPGHMCPISMTYAVVPALRCRPELAEIYEPLLTSRDYDPELKVPTTKAGMTAGMSMTEKQGGRTCALAPPRPPGTPTAATRSLGTSGSPRRRCVTSSWCSRRRPTG